MDMGGVTPGDSAKGASDGATNSKITNTAITVLISTNVGYAHHLRGGIHLPVGAAEEQEAQTVVGMQHHVRRADLLERLGHLGRCGEGQRHHHDLIAGPDPLSGAARRSLTLGLGARDQHHPRAVAQHHDILSAQRRLEGGQQLFAGQPLLDAKRDVRRDRRIDRVGKAQRLAQHFVGDLTRFRIPEGKGIDRCGTRRGRGGDGRSTFMRRPGGRTGGEHGKHQQTADLRPPGSERHDPATHRTRLSHSRQPSYSERPSRGLRSRTGCGSPSSRR